MLSILLKLSFGLLLFNAIVIHGVDSNEVEHSSDELNALLTQNEKIDGLFQQVENGFINKGEYGIVLEGIRISDKLQVAMKFVRKEFGDAAKREYEMYTYLKATCNETDVRKFGFANVYHYNEDWNGYFLTILSFFSWGNLLDKENKVYFNHSVRFYDINTLIVLRDFVRQSKYMHSCRIKHNNIQPEHIVLRCDRSFLINFSKGSKTHFPNPRGSSKFASRRTHNNQITTPICDWESFLYSLCFISNVELGWFFDSKYENMNTDEADKEFKEMKEKTNITEIIKKAFKEDLQKVLIEFSKEIFEREKTIPDYDKLYEKITKAIGAEFMATFTWLEGSRTNVRFHNLINFFDIKKDIVLPPDDHEYKYPEVNYNKFTPTTTNKIT